MAAPRILVTGGGTGGHLYPALNLAGALRRRSPGAELLYVGARRGIEARVLPERELPYRLLPVEPLYRSRPWRNVRTAARLPAALLGVAGIFRAFRPELVVATGGYVSGPPLAWGVLSGCRTAIQEQNAWPGIVTRWMARHVDQLHLGYPEARQALRPGRRTEVFSLGNPVAPASGEGSSGAVGRAPEWPTGRVVLVIGGSQGARGLNERLLADLSRASAWPADVRLVWIAGPEHAESIGARVRRLPWAEWIRVVPFVEGLGRKLGGIELAVSRAGAMMLAELAAAGVPSVLVPFPDAAGGHQSANARAMEAAGAAVVCEEAAWEPGRLWGLAGAILADPARRERMAAAARARGVPDAADRIAVEMLRLLAPGMSSPDRETADG